MKFKPPKINDELFIVIIKVGIVAALFCILAGVLYK